jgi:hypothetical protein
MSFREGPAEVKFVKMDSKGAIKISKDGLELDNQGNNFETCKADVKVRGGKWYYEVKLMTYGKIHIGWCNSTCNIQANAYTGIGNDNDSWSYDGSSQKAWTGVNGAGTRYGEYWNNGDVIGTVLDLEAKTISFYKNGNDLGVAFPSIPVGDGLYPAISLQKKQKVTINFGKTPFKYPINEVFPDIHPLHLNLSESQQKDLEKLFDKYKTIGANLTESGEIEDLVKGQGLLQYGQDLGITDDKDPMLMIISWKLNVSHGKVWEFNRDEWMGWAIHGCHNVSSMQKKCKEWRDELKNSAKFKQFYNYVFDYLREEKKVLVMEEAVTVWDMLGFSDRWPLFSHWVKFLHDKKSVSKDTWKLFLNFSEQYPKDLANYDENGCWPSVIDEFVEKVKEANKMKD